MKTKTPDPKLLHAYAPASFTPRQAQLILKGLDKLGWGTAEVRSIAPAIDELERVAAMAPRPAPPGPPAGA